MILFTSNKHSENPEGETMKFKSTIAVLFILTSLSTLASEIMLSPVFTVVGVVRYVLISSVETRVSPLGSILASTQQKEQLKVIRQDAVNFLSGDEMTQNLSDTITLLQQREELAGKDPVELAAHILTAIN